MSSYIRPKTLTAIQQAAALRSDWQSLAVTTRGHEVEARGVLQPSRISDEYEIRITYRVGGWPKAYVHRPSLARRPEEPLVRIPHTYPSNDGSEERPCLFLPGSGEWHVGKLVSRTIVPWLMTWLVDYEVWRGTGKWLGGGVAHNNRKVQ